MRHIDVYLSLLEKRFGKPRKKILAIDLEIEFRVGDIAEMVLIIARAMFPLGIPKIQLARVNSGGPEKAVAWLQLANEGVAMYGTPAFESTRVGIRIRNSLIAKAPFQTVSFAIAHEFAHLVLYSVGETNHDEKYVDLLAMYFGFAEFYEQGKYYGSSASSSTGDVLKDVLASLQGPVIREGVGYLSESEVQYARKAIALKRR